MARVVQNDKGFKVIALSHEEGEKIGWGLWTRSEDNTEDEYANRNKLNKKGTLDNLLKEWKEKGIMPTII